MQHFQVCDCVDKPVGTEKQMLPCLHGADVAVALGVRVGPQGTGNEIAVGMAAGLLGGDVAPVHHALHQRVVLGNASDAVFADMVGPAVSHVGDHNTVRIGYGGHQSGAHIPVVLVFFSCRPDGIVGK